MAGLRPETPVPVEIKLHSKSRMLEITFDNGDRFELSYEFLRVFSPSAEVRGHGIGQEKLQIGKRDVDILRIEPVGNYAVRIVFDDFHDSGLFTWSYLDNFDPEVVSQSGEVYPQQSVYNVGLTINF